MNPDILIPKAEANKAASSAIENNNNFPAEEKPSDYDLIMGETQKSLLQFMIDLNNSNRFFYVNKIITKTSAQIDNKITHNFHT